MKRYDPTTSLIEIKAELQQMNKLISQDIIKLINHHCSVNSETKVVLNDLFRIRNRVNKIIE